MADSRIPDTVRAGTLLFTVVTAWIVGVPASAETAAADVRAVTVETRPRASEYVAVIRAPHTAEFGVTITTGTAVASSSVPDGCGPGSLAVEQVITVEDQAPAEIPVPTRTVLECSLGLLDAGAERRVILPVNDLHSGTRTISVQLHDESAVIDRVVWSHQPFSVCAPPDPAPTWTHDTSANGSAGTAPARATGHIAGAARPGTRITLTGIDACEQPVDRTVVVPDMGVFRFTGLMTGHYALLDSEGRVLRHVVLSDDAPRAEDLIVVTAE